MKPAEQIVLISGGASGMGLACAKHLSLLGFRLVIWDKRVEGASLPAGSLALSCDVSSSTEVEAAMAETVTRVGIPQICINCAGIAPAARMVGKKGVMPLDDFKQVIDTNLVGTFNVMRVAAGKMIELPLAQGTEERGVIINTASVAAFEGQIGQLAYAASKGGVVAMTLPAARELAEYAIRVNTIAPGLIATPMLLGMPTEVQERLAATVTFPKRLGKPEEFASLVLHLIENTLINGEVIRLDGALRMQAR